MLFFCSHGVQFSIKAEMKEPGTKVGLKDLTHSLVKKTKSCLKLFKYIKHNTSLINTCLFCITYNTVIQQDLSVVYY